MALVPDQAARMTSTRDVTWFPYETSGPLFRAPAGLPDRLRRAVASAYLSTRAGDKVEDHVPRHQERNP
jgi:hypothetical protein